MFDLVLGRLLGRQALLALLFRARFGSLLLIDSDLAITGCAVGTMLLPVGLGFVGRFRRRLNRRVGRAGQRLKRSDSTVYVRDKLAAVPKHKENSGGD